MPKNAKPELTMVPPIHILGGPIAVGQAFFVSLLLILNNATFINGAPSLKMNSDCLPAVMGSSVAQTASIGYSRIIGADP